MSQVGAVSRDALSRRHRTRRDEPPVPTFFEPGAGRRTGVVVRDRGVRDEDGLEPLDGFFSSPTKNAGPTPRLGGRSAGAQPASSVAQSRTSARFVPPPPSRSPILTNLNTSPRRPSTAKRLSTVRSTQITPATEASLTRSTPSVVRSGAVARRLDFTTASAAFSSPLVPQNLRQPGSGQKRARETANESGDDAAPDPFPTRASPPKRQHADRDSRLNGFQPSECELVPTVYSDEDDEPVLPISEPNQADLDDSVYDFPVTAADEQVRRPSFVAPLLDPVDDDPSVVIDVSEDDVVPPISSSQPAPTKAQGGKKRRVHPRDRNPKARISSVGSWFVQPEDTLPTKHRPTSEADPEPEATVELEPEPVPDVVEDDEPVESAPVAKPKGRQPKKDPPAKSGTAKESRRQPVRSLQILSQPDQELRKSRRGRTVIRPISWWCGEKIDRAYDGTIQGVTRVDESTMCDPKLADIGTRKTVRKTKAKPEPSKGRGRAAAVPAPVDEDEDEWEKDGQVLLAWLPKWDPAQSKKPADRAGADKTALEKNEIAFSRNSLVTAPGRSKSSTYRFSKFLSMPFIGAGVVDIPPGGKKDTCSSAASHTVFFVHSGRVWVYVGDATADLSDRAGSDAQPRQCEFTIGAGGSWMVPRGAYYAIGNDFNEEARLFFVQANERESLPAVTGPTVDGVGSSAGTDQESTVVAEPEAKSSRAANSGSRRGAASRAQKAGSVRLDDDKPEDESIVDDGDDGESDNNTTMTNGTAKPASKAAPQRGRAKAARGRAKKATGRKR